MRLSTSETRELRRGGTINRDYINRDTGEHYLAEVKLSWDRLYYRVNDGPWCRTPGDARRAVDTTDR